MLLKEVHDLLLMPALPMAIPHSALLLYERSEVFRRQISSLELIVDMRNDMEANMLPIERELLHGNMYIVDICLSKGVEVGIQLHM